MEDLLFSLSKQVRTNRGGNVWEFIIDNCLYHLTIEDADAEIVKEDLGEQQVFSDGPFYSLTLVSMLDKAANRKQVEELVHLIRKAMPVCGVAK